MDISVDKTHALRAETHSHPPVVLIYDARGNGGVLCVPRSRETTPDIATTTCP